jgi:hypothetical protein
MTNLVSGTNLAAIRPGFIAEVCIPEEGEAQRRTLSALVGQLKQDPIFANVDLVAADRIRPIVDPKVTIPGRTFSVALELATNEFVRPMRLPRFQPPAVHTNKDSRPVRNMFRPGERPSVSDPGAGGSP